MNPSYRQTFNRHRLLFSLPIVITTLLAIWFVAGTPKQYRAGTTLSTDNAQGQSFLNEQNPGLIPPSARAQQLLMGLLATRKFQQEVGQSGPLDRYLAQHPSAGWGPTALLKKLRGGSGVADLRAAALDAKHVVTATPSGTVLSIQLQGPTPQVAVGTLRGLIDSLNGRRRELDVSREQVLMTRFGVQISAAKATLARLSKQMNSGNLSSAEVLGLGPVQRTAQAQLRNATRGYNQAALALDGAKREGATYQVIDEPALPAPAVSGMKKSVMMVFAGAFVGFLISLLAVVLSTSTDSRPAEEELRDVVAQAHNDPVPLDLDATKTSNGNGSGAHQDEPTRAERAKRTG
jgi:hypothetical protein